MKIIQVPVYTLNYGKIMPWSLRAATEGMEEDLQPTINNRNTTH